MEVKYQYNIGLNVVCSIAILGLSYFLSWCIIYIPASVLQECTVSQTQKSQGKYHGYASSLYIRFSVWNWDLGSHLYLDSHYCSLLSFFGRNADNYNERLMS